MKIYLLLLFLVLSFALKAQDYMPIDTLNKEKLELLAKDFKKSNKGFIDEVTDKYHRKVANSLEEYLLELSTEYIEGIKDGDYLFDKRFTSMADEILDEFKLKNPTIPKNTKILVSRKPNLNAYCLPDGTFILNLGLFYWLKNTDQIAGVMAHEISHKMLEHAINFKVKTIEEELSDDSKDKIKEIKKGKYNKNEKAFDFFKNILYAKGEKRKMQEYEADSLGYILLKNTKYNKLDYIITLKLMDKYDSINPKGLEIEIYKKVFNLPNQKFKEEWLKKEDFSGYNYSLYKEKFNEDSLSTHPDLDERIKKIEVLYPELKNPTSNETTEAFKTLNKIAEYEIIPNLIYFDEYGLAIYVCLSNIQSNKDVDFYNKCLGKIFEKIYDAKKQYKLNRYVDRIDPKDQTESYIQFLNFMWNLKLDEIKNIAAFYNK